MPLPLFLYLFLTWARSLQVLKELELDAKYIREPGAPFARRP